MDFSSLSQLKVADLKQHLRQRGLITTGNKTDLIKRLSDSIMKESGIAMSATTNLMTDPSMLGQQQQQPTDLSKMSMNPNEIDEDAILGDDDDEDEDVDGEVDDETSNSQLIDRIPNEELLLSDQTPATIVTPTNYKNDKSEPKSNLLNLKQHSTTSKQSTSVAATTNSPSSLKTTSATAVKPTIVTTITTSSLSSSSSIPTLKQLATKITSAASPSPSLTSEERKRMRQLKFADPKLLNRAQRFAAGNGDSKKLLDKIIEPSENSKLLKRMERFGEALSTKVKTLDERERLERRKDRFNDNQTSTNKIIVNNNLIVSDNIRKRQQRFGIVEQQQPQTKQFSNAKRNLNRFKKQRFTY